MKSGDACLKWVEWSDEDHVYIGRCPDLFSGGCHGDDPVQVYAELCEIVEDTVADMKMRGEVMPPVSTHPLAAA